MNLPFDEDLTRPAAILALAAPREWQEFLAGLTKYAASRRLQMEKSSLDELQKSQGRAQQCTSLVALFDAAVQSANNRSNAPAGKPKQ